MQDITITHPDSGGDEEYNRDPAQPYSPAYRADVERIACELLVPCITQQKLPMMGNGYLHEIPADELIAIANVRAADLITMRIALDPTWIKFVNTDAAALAEAADYPKTNPSIRHNKARRELAGMIECFRYSWDRITTAGHPRSDEDGTWTQTAQIESAERQECEVTLLRAITRFAGRFYEKACADFLLGR